MTRSFIVLLSLVLQVSLWASNPKKSKVIAPGANVVKLAGGFSFTEGPAADSQGNVYFTDQPNNKIHIWKTDGRLETFLDNSGRANGLFFDRNGNLLACSDMENELWSIAPDKTHTALVSEYNGKRLNGPNDLWIHPDGGIYFTDPLYVRPFWTRNPEMEQESEQVYYLSPNRKTLVRVTTDLEKPNGIIGTPDGKKLYVADIGANKTYSYEIQSDGSLVSKKLFVELGSDGMTIDQKGNVYLTGNGVTVFNAKGKKIGHIPVDAPWTANVCFGGKEMKTLFITASDGLYAVEMKVRGVNR